MVHAQVGGTRRYPYDPPYYDHYEDALFVLLGSKKGGKPHIPTFARRVLDELKTYASARRGHIPHVG